MPRLHNTIATIITAAATTAAHADIANTDLAVISGGSLSTGRNVLVTGDIAASTSVWLDAGATVGDVAYGTSFNTHATAHYNQILTPSQWTAPVSPQYTPTGAAGDRLWIANQSTADINTGAHGSLSTGRSVSLNFSAGTYDFASIYTGRNAALNFDTTQGDVILTSDGNVSLDRNATFNVTGDGGVFIRTGGSFWAGRDSDITASVTAMGTVSLDRNVALEGSVFSATSVWIDRDSTLSYSAVPAPATIAVTAAVMGFASRRRR